MYKVLGVLLSGVFVGAVGMEILQRKFPNAKEQVTKFGENVAKAFKEGYQCATEKGSTATAKE